VLLVVLRFTPQQHVNFPHQTDNVHINGENIIIHIAHIGVKIHFTGVKMTPIEYHVKLMQDEILRYYFGEIR